MKWITHQTGAVLGSLALALPLPAIAAAGLGAILPDIIDQRISGLAKNRRARQKVFNRVHRGASHWFGWWLGLFVTSMICPMPELARDAALGFALGALTHVGMDMLTPQGVPWNPFSRKGKFSLPLCSTGKLSEWVFLALILLIGAMFLHGQILPTLASLKIYI